MMSELAIDLDSVEGTSIVALRCHGDIDAHTCAKLDTTMKGILGEGVSRVIVDLTDVPYMASRGLGVLIAARKHIEDTGGALALLNPNESVTAAIEVLGFDTVFSIVSTEQAAIEAVRQ
ncbi:MAG: STAS domain-containing protein [Planctomycetota bacterium]|jgi:anti-anti-sigma factor